MSTETVEISLAKALKLKNRLAGRLAKIDSDLETYNSVQSGIDPLDIRGLYATRKQLVAHLIELKVAVNSANQTIQRTIYELGEHKSLVALLGKLDTKHGKFVEEYRGTEIQYTAQLRKVDVDREVRRLEVEIDRLQELLDGFNHRTTIAINSNLLAELEALPLATKS